LTVNPETGLPEAGFLDSLLPAIIGAGAMYMTGGAAGAAMPGLFGMGMPATIGMGVGALQTARTGDLGKGIMAGLGAYGGAGMLGAAGQAGMLGGAEGTVPAAPDITGPTTLHPNMVGPDTSPIVSQSIGADTEQLASSLPKGNLLDNPLTPPTPTFGDLAMQNKGFAASAAAPVLMDAMQQNTATPPGTEQMIRPYTYAANPQTPTNMVAPSYQQGQDTSERMWFQPKFTALTPYSANQPKPFAAGGPIEQMSNANQLGMNTDYPGAAVSQGAYATPWQTPVSRNVVTGSADVGVNPMNGEMTFAGGGGISSLGGYSDGGRMLKGPGDGMSDSIPAQIGSKQPARLADGEFVVPADVVSHLGNGSTDAGARQLYSMMDRIRSQRTGKKKQAPKVNPSKAMPA
jgi:hypothetical protein